MTAGFDTNLGWRALGDDAPEVEHVDVVAHVEHQAHVVVDEEHGHVAFEEVTEVVAEQLALGGVEAGGRLVEQQQLRPAASPRATLTSLRWPCDRSVGEHGRAGRRGRACRAPTRPGPRRPDVRFGRTRSARNDHHFGRSAIASRLSHTVRSSNSSSDWNVRTSPLSARSAGAGLLMSWPSNTDRARPTAA